MSYEQDDRPLAPGWTELFGSGMRLPENVCIVAPGPNGIGHYRDIPKEYFLIAVSKAILIDELNPAMWIMTHASQDLFGEANGRCRCLRVFGAGALRDRPALPAGPDRFYFECQEEELLVGGLLQSIERRVRRGASISSCAVQVAYNLGAKKILLCGVDMSGDSYWDGSINHDQEHGETWTAVDGFHALIRFLSLERNISVSSLSPTKLKVPRFESLPL
jgi:hypothetical protein